MEPDTTFVEELHDNFLEHIGIKRRSGRYPWGSGADPLQRSRDFKSYLDNIKTSTNMSDSEIANYIHEMTKTGEPHEHKFTTTDLRAAIAVSTEEISAANRRMAYRLSNVGEDGKGMSNTAIAKRMGTRESTVRGWLKQGQEYKANSLQATAEVLKKHLDTKPFLDVGKGTELFMGISDTKLRTALVMLRDEGHEIHLVKQNQLGTGLPTEYKILTKPDVGWREARDALNTGQVRNITDVSDDGGQTYKSPKVEPVSVSSKRMEVRYKEDGGAAMDGVIELRRNVEDLNLQGARYAQVRVAVDGTHYLKGMAMYADDMPAGKDIRFNSAKSKNGSDLNALKPMETNDKGEIDKLNPFGASTYPKVYTTKRGKEQTSSLNIVGTRPGSGNEEGKWNDWASSLSSQMLSKQSVRLAAEQLGKTQTDRQKELDGIMKLTNPVVKQKLLDEFADSADSAAVHLKAAALPRQSSHVILPMNSMRPNEIYAPNFNNGEKVVLVRYPHGGPFEIPELTVNNKNRTAQRVIKGALDAVGIHHTVAEQLSGADFDGDSVIVIPNDSGKVKTRPALAGLKGFDAKAEYGIPEGDTTTVRMTKANTQKEMGKISNLITDMNIKRASDDEMARAVRHSMVVIDANKHNLDYKASAADHNIAQLKTKYQGGPTKGASTIISRSSSDDRVPEIRLRSKSKDGEGPVDPKTGALVYVPTGRTYVDKNGITKPYMTKGAKGALTTDAFTLTGPNAKTPGEPMEELYASHANSMKALANEARKASVAIHPPRQSTAAKAYYAKEVQSLKQKLQVAERNAPIERRAQTLGHAMAQAQIDANPQYEKDDVKRVKFAALEEARNITGASKIKVEIEPREWDAIQSSAVAASTLRSILRHTDPEKVKALATPRPRTSLTPGQISRAKSMAASGRSLTEIAAELGIPRSTLSDNLKA